MARYDPLPYVREARPRNLRLADLYLRQGEAQAEAERRRGDIQAQLWGGVANTIGQTASRMIEAPQIERERKAKEASDAQVAESRELTLGQQRRDVNDRENFDKAMGAGSRQRTLEALKDRPELYAKAQEHFTSIDTTMKKLMGDVAAGVADFGYTPDAAIAGLDDLIEQGFDERKLEQYRAAIQQNPESVKQIVDSLLAQSPDPRHQAMAKPKPLVELNKDTSLYDPNTGQTVAQGPQSPPPREPNPTEASLAAAAAAGDPEAVKALELLRAQRPPQREPKGATFWVIRNNKPIRVTDATYQEGDLPASTREQGRPVTSGDANRMADLNTSLDDVEVLTGVLGGVSGSTGTSAKVGAMLPNWVTELTGRGVSAKQKQATIDRVKQVIGKALEGGVLRKEDEAKYEKILPTIYDPPAVVTTKLDGLKTALTQRRQTLIDALTDAGYDTADYVERQGGGSGRVYYDDNGNPIQKKP